MKKIICLQTVIMMVLVSWAGSASAFYHTKVISPWKEATRTVYPNFNGDTVRITHVQQRTKIHSITLNDQRVIYTFEGDSSIPDHRGQIKFEGNDIVVQLEKRELISSLSIRSEGWNAPRDGNIYEVILTNSIKLKHSAKWSGYKENILLLNKSKRARVNSIRIAVSGKTKFHTLKLLDGDKVAYDLLQSTIFPELVENDFTLRLNKNVAATSLLIKAESYSTERGADTSVSLNLARASAPPKPPVEKRKCSHNGIEYSEGQRWSEYSTRSEAAYCEFGGNKREVYSVDQPKICRRGRAVNDGRSTSTWSHATGYCSSAPRPASCIHNGTTYRDGGAWRVYIRTAERAADCRHGGNRVNRYDVYQPKICSAGVVLNNGSVELELVDFTGKCRAKRPRKKGCDSANGRKRHLEKWVITLVNRPITKKAHCDYGGNKVKLFENKVEMQCDDGDKKRINSWEGRHYKTEGKCNKKPKTKPKKPKPTKPHCREGSIKEVRRPCGRGKIGHYRDQMVCVNRKWELDSTSNNCTESVR